MRVPFFCTLLVILTLGVALGQDTSFAVGPQYLLNSGSSLFARPISTPSLSLGSPSLQVGASDATGVLLPGAEDQTTLPPTAVAEPAIDLSPILYGNGPSGVSGTSSAGASSIQTSSPSAQPAGLFDTGVWEMTTAKNLREQGYGISVAQAAAHVKARVRTTTHVYTNADIDRLNSGDNDRLQRNK